MQAPKVEEISESVKRPDFHPDLLKQISAEISLLVNSVCRSDNKVGARGGGLRKLSKTYRTHNGSLCSESATYFLFKWHQSAVTLFLGDVGVETGKSSSCLSYPLCV